jgi:predicted flap endonuclease-1-like 5' DNA nuclease
MQQRLNHIGIHTYGQLALANPEALRESLGEIGRRMKCEDWIAQALELTRRDTSAG